MLVRFFSYVVARDYGFAPNPFNGICTLATCKQGIRRSAAVGDWVIGTGSVKFGLKNHLIYAMQVTRKLTFNDYWNSEIYETKKAVMNASLKKMYGDNIYYHDGKQWRQADSHHSLENGKVNIHNLERDTSANAVLISETFFYFGRAAVKIPKRFVDHIVIKRQGYRCPEEQCGVEFINYMTDSYGYGYHEDPVQFNAFKRYAGKR